jgi:hypothetical protein
MLTQAEACRKAADIIAERGHVKHTFRTPDGYCLTGALAEALGGRWISLPRVLPGGGVNFTASPSFRGDGYAAWADLCDAAGDFLGCLPAQFNDSPETSAEDVILALKRFAEALDR